MSDAPPPSTNTPLLERLQKITGLRAVAAAPDKLEAPLPPGPPPVDKLIASLKDGLVLAAGCGIAGAVLGVALLIRLWQGMKPAASAAGRMFARAGRQIQSRAAGVSQAVRAKAAALREKTPDASPPAAVEPPPAIAKTEAAAPVSEPVETPAASAVPAAPRRWRRPALLISAGTVAGAGLLALIPAVRYSFTDWMGWGNATVTAGADGWIFLRRELAPSRPAASLKDTAAALRSKGATLAVLSLPSRAAVYPDKTGATPTLTRPQHIQAALHELTGAGASVFDLAPLLAAQKSSDAKEGALFNAQDTLWSPRGMIASAAAAASYLQSLPVSSTLPVNPSLAVMEPVSAPPALGALVSEWQTERSRSRYQPVVHPLIQLLTPERKEPLPDDPAGPVVLLGGPQAAAYGASAGFPAHLGYLLNTRVHTVTAASGAAAAAAWLNNGPPAESAKLIVWLLEDADLSAAP